MFLFVQLSDCNLFCDLLGWKHYRNFFFIKALTELNQIKQIQEVLQIPHPLPIVSSAQSRKTVGETTVPMFASLANSSAPGISFW